MIGNGNCVSSISHFAERGNLPALSLWLPVHGLCLSHEHGAGPAHLGVIHAYMFASSVASGAPCVRVTKCADGTNSHARALSVCALHVFLSKALRTTTQGPEIRGVWCAGIVEVSLGLLKITSVYLNFRDVPRHINKLRPNNRAFQEKS